MNTRKTAQFIKDLSGFRGDAKRYKVTPRVKIAEGKSVSHVVVSAVIAMFSGPETYIFPADRDGEVVSWGEMEGSYRGGLDHEQALQNAGYRLVKAVQEASE